MERWHDEFDNRNDACDLAALLHPSQAFDHPSDVVSDPDLTLNELPLIEMLNCRSNSKQLFSPMHGRPT
jgi:hypothetical protein